MRYKVYDLQGAGWKEDRLWWSIKQVADTIRDYPDYMEEAEGLDVLSDNEVLSIWGFETEKTTLKEKVEWLRRGRKESRYV
jgi:hypothetical protein